MNNDLKNGIVITITVVLVLAVVYLTTAVFMTGEIGSSKANKKNKVTTTKSNVTTNLYDNMIIASKTFDQPNDEYMVIFFSEKEASDNLKSAISSYDSGNKAVKLYKVNTDEVINKFVVSEEVNMDATNYNELKINDVTIITIKDKVITSYVVKEEAVIDKLK